MSQLDSLSGVLFDYDRQPTPGQKLRREISSRQSLTRDGFGCSSLRFGSPELTSTPGVGSYAVEKEESFILHSPSLSKKGYVSSFVSKSSRMAPVYRNLGIPGPATYDTHVDEISYIPDKRPSTAFKASGNGRVPFPAPNKVPGPNAYKINADPGRSPLLTNKTSATFASKSKRESLFKVNDVPRAGKYNPEKLRNLATGDLQWTKSTYVRFQDLGKDNEVPGPQRYFHPKNFDEYYPKKTLRTAGNYKGTYVGKINQPPPTVPTFGADLDRFKHSTFGRLDLAAENPGPGSYYDDLMKLSGFSPPASRNGSPSRAATSASPSPTRRPKTLHRDYIL